MKLLSRTMVGSHIWKMDTSESDKDYFDIYLEATEDIFRGIARFKSKHYKEPLNVDIVTHELSHVIGQLLKGNINFLIGVASPIVINSNEWFEELRDITLRNVSQNTYHSIRGLAIHNYEKYIDDRRGISIRKANQILRILEFGINLLKYRKLKFDAFTGGTPELIELKVKELKDVFENSTIPEKPDEDAFRDYLLKMRKWEWWGNLDDLQEY